MAQCTIIPIGTTPPSCSGKCSKRECGTSPALWVVAACEGMMALFEKKADGKMQLVPQGEHLVSPSMDSLRDYVQLAITSRRVGQMILVGAATDVSWTHTILPDAALKCVVAEIHYPLMTNWFRTSADLATLAHTLSRVVEG